MTFGVNGMYQNNKSLNATDFPIPDFNLLDIGPYIYLHHTWNRWSLSGGIRYDNRSLKGADFYTTQNPSPDFSNMYFLLTQRVLIYNSRHLIKPLRGFHLVRVSTYEINEQISVKANIARGFRAPNISEFASNGLDPGAHIVYLGNRQAVPEFSLQEDAGIEMNFKDLSVYVSCLITISRIISMNRRKRMIRAIRLSWWPEIKHSNMYRHLQNYSVSRQR